MRLRRVITTGLLTLVFIVIYLSVYGTGTVPRPVIVYNHPTVEELSDGSKQKRSRRLSLNARSALVIDNGDSSWIYAKRAQTIRPIASLTKLLTAMVYLDARPNLDTTVYISNRDCYNSAKSNLYRGEGYKACDLLYAALMASDNRAARALATASGMPRLQFVEKMNEKAVSLGMMNTELFEVTGLDERNVSTATDIAVLINKTLEYPAICKTASTYIYKCKLQNKRRTKRFINTNRMVRSRWEVLAGKTGFIMESDYCLATVMRDKSGKEITLVVLGSPTNNIRFKVARKLAFYGFDKAGRYEDGKQIASR